MVATALEYARACAARAESSDARLESIEQQLQINFTRIAQMQAEIDQIKKLLTARRS